MRTAISVIFAKHKVKRRFPRRLWKVLVTLTSVTPKTGLKNLSL